MMIINTPVDTPVVITTVVSTIISTRSMIAILIMMWCTTATCWTGSVIATRSNNSAESLLLGTTTIAIITYRTATFDWTLYMKL